MREKLKNEPSFKFYDEDSSASANQIKNHQYKNSIEVWEE